MHAHNAQGAAWFLKQQIICGWLGFEPSRMPIQIGSSVQVVPFFGPHEPAAEAGLHGVEDQFGGSRKMRRQLSRIVNGTIAHK
jgi:hypothetical protein